MDIILITYSAINFLLPEAAAHDTKQSASLEHLFAQAVALGRHPKISAAQALYVEEH